MLLPQLVLIPGLLNDADVWRDQVAGLDAAARPLVADITQGETLARLAQDVLEVAESRLLWRASRWEVPWQWKS